MDLNTLLRNASSLKFSRHNAHVMSLCLTLHVNLGLSLRKTSQTLKDLYNISISHQQIQFYCGRGKMENFIKESKGGFDFTAVSSHSKVVNANRMRLHMLAYNLFNWFRRLVLPANMRKQQVDTIRLKLIKIAARAVCSARYITFKLCSSCPYKKEFYRTLENIRQLTVQLE